MGRPQVGEITMLPTVVLGLHQTSIPQTSTKDMIPGPLCITTQLQLNPLNPPTTTQRNPHTTIHIRLRK